MRTTRGCRGENAKVPPEKTREQGILDLAAPLAPIILPLSWTKVKNPKAAAAMRVLLFATSLSALGPLG
jgi:hypothetical protein